MKGQRCNDKDLSPWFGELYPEHGDKVSVSSYSNHSTELVGEESCSILLCTMFPWRTRRKTTSTLTHRNQWVKGDNSFSAVGSLHAEVVLTFFFFNMFSPSLQPNETEYLRLSHTTSLQAQP